MVKFILIFAIFVRVDHSCFIIKMDHSKQTEIKRKLNISRMKAHILLISKKNLKAYLILLKYNNFTICKAFADVHSFLPKFAFVLNLSSWFSKNRSERKTRTRVEMNCIKLRSFKNLFSRFRSKYLCCDLQNEITETCLQNDTISHGWNLQKLYYLIGWLCDNFLFFITWFAQDKTATVSGTSFMLSSV